MKKLFTTVMLSLPFMMFAQLPYTENDFSYTIETDVEYGQALNYAGFMDTLLMDIYKPVGDDNCARPCLVLVHGGTFIAGSKEDPYIVNIAKSYAEKGWVVATINYRLGTHKTSSYVMYALCNDDISAPCGYIADSAEVFRANYRAQQDTKGAIRFMKNRHYMDSVDVGNVFVAGESAGAITVYAATFMNDASEKFPFCDGIADAPTPDADLVHCLPVGYSLTRPDLGPVEGTLNLGDYDSKVEGVGGFYGAMLNLDMLEDETDWPVVYMFHQGSDVVVHYNYARLLGRLDWECFSPLSLCQNYARYPKAFGSKGMESYFSGLADAPDRVVEIIENYEYTGDCFDNGHSIDNWVTRSNNMAELFANRIQENGNVPHAGPCDLGLQEESNLIAIYPNPTTGLVNFRVDNEELCSVNIYTSEGKLVQNFSFNQTSSIHLFSGIYIVEILSEGKRHYEKLIVY